MRAVVALVFVLAIAASGPPIVSGFAQTAQPSGPAETAAWIADPRSGCKVWNPEPQPAESVSWLGPCKNGLAEGSGTLQWFKDGKPNGTYNGEMREGRLAGQGTFVYGNGNSYEGAFENGKANGHGIAIWTNGWHYEGDWVNGNRTGRGAEVFPDGRRYEGEYLDNRANGQGRFTTPKGESYEGTWTNGCFQESERKLGVGPPGTKEVCGF